MVVVSPNCSICLDPLFNGNALSSTQCGHPFHSECLERWVTGQHYEPVCPMCKHPLRQWFEDPMGGEEFDDLFFPVFLPFEPHTAESSDKEHESVSLDKVDKMIESYSETPGKLKQLLTFLLKQKEKNQAASKKEIDNVKAKCAEKCKKLLQALDKHKQDSRDANRKREKYRDLLKEQQEEYQDLLEEQQIVFSKESQAWSQEKQGMLRLLADREKELKKASMYKQHDKELEMQNKSLDSRIKKLVLQNKEKEGEIARLQKALRKNQREGSHQRDASQHFVNKSSLEMLHVSALSGGEQQPVRNVGSLRHTAVPIGHAHTATAPPKRNRTFPRRSDFSGAGKKQKLKEMEGQYIKHGRGATGEIVKFHRGVHFP